MKLLILLGLVAAANAGACSTGVFTVPTGYKLWNTKTQPACTGSAGAKVFAAAVMRTSAEADTEYGGKNDGAAAAWYVCDTGYTGTVLLSCADATTRTLKGCTKVTAPAAKAACATAIPAVAAGAANLRYPAFGAGTAHGVQAKVKCNGDKMTGWAMQTCNDGSWAGSVTKTCATATWNQTPCPIPTTGVAETASVWTCNANSAVDADCAVAVTDTQKAYKCPAAGAGTVATCDNTALWAKAMGKTAAACTATGTTAIGSSKANYMCNIGCGVKTRVGASPTCKAITDVTATWSYVAPSGGGGGGGSGGDGGAASTLSTFTALVAILAYLW